MNLPMACPEYPTHEKPVVAVVSAGMMGAGIGRRLTEAGASVLTSVAGRSAATTERARRAGMIDASDEAIAACDVILSVLPPGEAPATARRFARAIANAGTAPLYADCNAVSPATARRIEQEFQHTGARFVDAGIIGGPPSADGRGPRIYLSGTQAPGLLSLADYGLDLRVQDGPVGAASAMKLSYAGITKGLTALCAAMMLAATRAGTAEALVAELADSQPQLLDRLTRQTPGMFPKAYRFVAEMEELADFTGDDPAARRIFEGAALLYEGIARDLDGEQTAVAALTRFAEMAAASRRSPDPDRR
nr:DUF1932 domain-containing protein [Micromonospora sp. DSM 115978]